MVETVMDSELDQLRARRISELRASSELATPFEGRDLALVSMLTIVIPAIALIWGWFAWA
jgi:hypothetical protein